MRHVAAFIIGSLLSSIALAQAKPISYEPKTPEETRWLKFLKENGFPATESNLRQVIRAAKRVERDAADGKIPLQYRANLEARAKINDLDALEFQADLARLEKKEKESELIFEEEVVERPASDADTVKATQGVANILGFKFRSHRPKRDIASAKPEIERQRPSLQALVSFGIALMALALVGLGFLLGSAGTVRVPRQFILRNSEPEWVEQIKKKAAPVAAKSRKENRAKKSG